MRYAKTLLFLSATSAVVIGGIGYCASPTGLHLAVRSGDVQAVRRAIADGGNADDGSISIAGFAAGEPRIERETPLMAACRLNNAEIVAALLKAGASPNLAGADSETALSIAVRAEPDTGIVAMLLQAGADPLQVTLKGRTPLEWSILYLALYSIPTLPDCIRRERVTASELTRLSALAQRRQDDLKHIVFKIIKEAAIDGGPEGETHTRLKERLREWLTNPNASDADGWTPLHWAAGPEGDRDSCVALLQAGAKLEARTSTGYTPLMAAVQSCDPARVEFLLEQGAKLVAADNDMCTALHIAAWRCSPFVYELLMKYGADQSLRNRWGQTAADLLGRRASLEARAR